ncbi:G_PROTEIN_RECEP_F1_2 domain-containing protein [Caenorhabditis elegans]|uniref:G_PROTEIN_RECEP_F1_2 domain-containing protein n=1 Tax=Caenorhabditis elegans TaxID=6239 RepID=Q9XUK6_CAEEL|nr:G_PROTEIN_RECEP_F1_2 domain-containing protein [Caenorhabditis elegans]CAB04930.1 G_PROTEIN_RECEP_F1_2 domain-containing protein [Caenorhabditis elegans]|eukprot:NP_508003.1 Serpentine Receptor, class XA [Caenorhabditis elegans]
MLYRLIAFSQIAFTLINLFCVIFDTTLLWCVIKQRCSLSRSSGPFVYIVFFTGFGIIEKVNNFIMVDAWPISEWWSPNGGYEKYRQLIGSNVTLVFLICYLTPLFLDWIITLHRISIFLSPLRSKIWFNDKNVSIYCVIVSILVIIWLLVQQLSSCTLNFNALTSFLESACAPDRHPITWFQNKFLIYVPIFSMVVNASMLFFQRISRKVSTSAALAKSISESQIKRENALIRQAMFIGAYLSIYEILYLQIRLYPESFNSAPFEFQTITYSLRLLAVGSLNFCVYFVLTKSTRAMVLKFLGYKTQTRAPTVSQTAKCHP